MPDPTRLFRGQGVLSIADRNVAGLPTGFVDMGNCSEVTLSPSVERIEHVEYRTGKQFKDKVIEKMVSAEIQFVAESTAVANLRRYFYSNSSQAAAGTISGEVVQAFKGKKAKLNRVNLTGWTTLTDANGTRTFVRDVDGDSRINVPQFDPATNLFTSNNHGLVNSTRLRLTTGTLPTGFSGTIDYFVIAATTNTFQLSATAGGTAVSGTSTGAGIVATVQYDYSVNLKTGVIDFYPNAGFTEGDYLRANYTAGTSEKIAAFTAINRDVYVMFEGLNTAENDSPVVLTVYKVRLDPAESWQMIGDEFANFTVKGTVLYDSQQPDNTIDGRYWKVEQVPV